MTEDEAQHNIVLSTHGTLLSINIITELNVSFQNVNCALIFVIRDEIIDYQ